MRCGARAQCVPEAVLLQLLQRLRQAVVEVVGDAGVVHPLVEQGHARNLVGVDDP